MTLVGRTVADVGYRLLAVGCWLSCAALLFFTALGCDSPAPSIESFSGPTMGTRYNISYASDGQSDADALAERQKVVDARLAEINKRMSTYDPESELSRFNNSDSTDWFEVSEETAKVVTFALEVAKETDGAFDPTVGPVVNLWGFGPDGRRKEPPSDKEIEASLKRVGYQNVDARLEPPGLKKSRRDIYIDLSAVAKGYASDAVSELLEKSGAAASMVEIGGEIACRGLKPGGEPWRIGVEKPDERGRALQTVVELTDQAVATSGDYRNYFRTDGMRYSHTIAPQTGRPVEHSLATVSVRANTCMEADAWATAILVMGPQQGYNWAQEHGVAAMLIERTKDGFAEKTTDAWR